MDGTHAPAQARAITPPTAAMSQRAMAEARRLFARTLSGWASDLLVVRADGLSGFTWTAEHTEHRWNRAA